MITTNLQSVSTLPLHTRTETAVGLAFDVLNGVRNSLQVDGQLNISSTGSSTKILSTALAQSAKEARAIVEKYFESKFLQEGIYAIRVESYGGGSVDIQLVRPLKD